MISTEKPGTPAELVHFGVKGMKWGIRRNREVSPERKAKREAKAQKFVKKASATQTKIDVMKAKPKQNYGQRLLYNRNVRISQLEKTKAQALKDAESKRQGKLSRRQKQVIVGGAVVGLLVAGGVLAVTMNSGQARQAMNRGREIVTGEKFEFKKNEAFKERDLTPDALHQVVSRGINPGFDTSPGAKMNCRRATFAYEMRRRGYDVEATKTPIGSGQNASGLLNAIDTKGKDVRTGVLAEMLRIKRANRRDPATRHVMDFTKRGSALRDIKPERSGAGLPLTDIFKRLAQEPERSRGEVVTTWNIGGAHSMAYEIIDGAAHIFDTQTGQHYRADVRGIGEIDLPGIASAGFTRLDNKELDKHFLQRWMK